MKNSVSQTNDYKEMTYDRFFNKISLARKPSLLREIPGMLASRPNCLNLAGGVPDPGTFPVTEATFYLRDGSELHMDEETMNVALQYNHTHGLPLLQQWISDLQRKVHSPPTMMNSDHPAQTTCIITNGSLEGLNKTIEALVSEGDNVLVEHPIYSGALANFRPLGCGLLPVQSDGMGIDPEDLGKILSRWTPADAMDPKSGIPKILYCVPSGGNPTGAGLTLERKKAIYRLAQEYDLLILEDDPYYYIQFSQNPVSSFLSLDTDGRVVRFDSFSKIFSSGIRVGFATGPKPVLQKICYHMMCSTMHSSVVSQMALEKVFLDWGYDGFLTHVNKIRDHYKEKSLQCVAAAEKYLTGLAKWTIPSGGMFLWLKLLNVTDTYHLVMNKVYNRDVLFVPGKVFYIDNTAPCPYIRASFSTVTAEQMEQAFSTLAEVLKENL